MTKMKDQAEKKVALVAQELKLARILADNNKSTRDRALKNLKKWLLHGSKLMKLTEDDFLRIWKGLFYSMWMSDKPLVQEECAESISSLVHLPSAELSMIFFKSGLQMLMQEWFGIDQLRLDKFMMFVRRFLRQALFVLKEHKWSAHAVDKFCEAISTSILDNSSKYSCLGLKMHFIEIYWEEVAKVSEGTLRCEIITKLVKPFIRNIATAKDNRLTGHIKKFIFVYLIRQSELGLEYQSKYEVWKQMGFPGSIDSLQKVKLTDEETCDDESLLEDNTDSDKILDPRAGRVDVELNQLKISPKGIISALSEVKFSPETTTKTRRIISQLIEQFQKMASGIYPFGIKKLRSSENDCYDTSIRKAVNRLVKFEKKGSSRKKNKDKKETVNDTLKNYQSVTELADNLRDKENHAIKKRQNSNTIKAVTLKRQRLNDFTGDPEYIFKRNSGTWYVYDTTAEDVSSTSAVCESSMSCDGGSPKKGSTLHMSPKRVKLNSPNAKLDKDNKNSPSPIKLFESPPDEKKELFQKNDWNEPLQEGEYEICIFSTKTKYPTSSVQENGKNKLVINKTVTQLKRRSRLSLDPQLIKDPFARASASAKKVKINTKLNRSQEIHEHLSNILNSPAIPYDATRKPEKPLLKTSFIGSPVNPFTKQLEF